MRLAGGVCFDKIGRGPVNWGTDPAAVRGGWFLLCVALSGFPGPAAAADPAVIY